MTDQQKARVLGTVLPVVGVIFVFGVWLLMRIWPAGWQWQPNQHEYEQMFQGVYATLGIFLILAARAPHKHRSLILFAAWSSLVHAGIMAVQALRDTAERGHLIGDVPALAVVGIVLLVLTPKAMSSSGQGRGNKDRALDRQAA
jgi:MFS superfamily sulfate permease-like transporter